MKAERARWQRYCVTPPEGSSNPIAIATELGAMAVRNRPIVCRMTKEAADEARERGCEVVIVDGNVSIGGIAGVCAF